MEATVAEVSSGGAETVWCGWDEARRSGPAKFPEAQLTSRLIDSTLTADGVAGYVRGALAELAAEYAASWTAVFCRSPQWEKWGEFGRLPWEGFPTSLAEQVLDRNAGLFVSSVGIPESQGWSLTVLPMAPGGSPPAVLAMCSKSLSTNVLPSVMSLLPTFAACIELVRRGERSRVRVERLRATLQTASQWGATRETAPLLESIAYAAAKLLDADRSSIFIWDREHREMVACPALGVAGQYLRLPDHAGIVGECLQTGRVVRVDDAYADPRFNQAVDKQSGYRTRNLLCVPLIDPDGQRIGAFEAINKRAGDFTDEDAESLADLGTQAAIALQNARERESLVRRQQQLTAQVAEGVQIIGDSPAIAALRATVQRLAGTDLPVLILGESGTGKEVVAQALHYLGARRQQPFVAVNCAALPETLLESELFGHEKGAFTDAHEARPGKFELAEGGTLFLDEIGDMSARGQAELLRVLEQKVLIRVGGVQPIHTNVRVVAATNKQLAQAVREKRFREDLYYRLSVVALELPPLRERPDDIQPLAEFFLQRFCRQAGRRPLTLAAEARRRLQAHPWPGNVRELRNLMERVAFLTSRERVEPEDLAFMLSPDAGTATSESADVDLPAATARFQAEFIRKVIKRVKGNMTEASRLLGLHRSNLYRKMRQLGMSEAPAAELEPE